MVLIDTLLIDNIILVVNLIGYYGSIFHSSLSVVGTVRSSSPLTLPRTNSLHSSTSEQEGGLEGGGNNGGSGSDVPEPALTPRSELEDADNVH